MINLKRFAMNKKIGLIFDLYCCPSFIGEAEFDAVMDQEEGTFFPADYTVDHFERIMMEDI